MKSGQGNQDIFVSVSEFDLLDVASRELRETKERVEAQNLQLKRIVKEMSSSLQDVSQKTMQIDSLKMKVYLLSKGSLKLGRQIIELEEKMGCYNAQDNSQREKQLEAKSQESRQIENKSMILLDEVSAWKENYRYLEEDKNMEEKRLRQQIEKLRTRGDQKEQQKIIKSWRLSNESVHKSRQMVESDFSAQLIRKLKAKVLKLLAERDQNKIIMINERNIVESFRRQLVDKQKDYNHLHQKYRSLHGDFQRKEAQLLKTLSLKMKELEKEYQSKVISLKAFNSSFDEAKRAEKEKEKLKEKLSVSVQESSERQKVINYMNTILTNISESQKMSMEKAIDLQVIQFEAEMLKKSTSERQKKLELKMMELVERVRIKTHEIESQLKV